MATPMRLNAFTMNCVGHQSQGLWRHPRDRSMEYTSIEHWVELARTLERGCFDTVFLADVLGVYDVYGGGPDAAVRTAAQVPVNDPMLVVPVMAAVTEHLGFGITGITSFEPPYTFARRMSTLDHLTAGRVSWNIVTGYLDSAARAMGVSAKVLCESCSSSSSPYTGSVGLMAFSWLSPPSGSGKPSTTNSGLLLPADEIPRMRMAVPAAPPGAPPPEVMVTPDTLP